jgi:hypothetical protein
MFPAGIDPSAPPSPPNSYDIIFSISSISPLSGVGIPLSFFSSAAAG